MLLQDFLNKIEKFFRFTPEVEVDTKNKHFNIRSYKGKQFMIGETNVRLPLVNPDIESLNKSINQKIDTGCKISKITITVEEFGYKYTKELDVEDVQELENKLNSEEIVDKIIIKGEK